MSIDNVERDEYIELKIDNLLQGDILLCFSPITANEEQAGPTGYSHVAIVIADKAVLEASTEGVRLVTPESLLEDYRHIAVMRAENTWCKSRLDKLEQFAKRNVGKKFNWMGLRKVPERKEVYSGNIMSRMEAFFDNSAPPVKSLRGVYFCSELVTEAFIYVGIIDASAAVVFTPETFSPSDIAQDKAFGFFCGYVKSYAEYQIPESDYFRQGI